ncbi:MAG TPA: AIPR family protein, partial [Polyangiaceae bacterium]|nr:AIPR family protein [Polyangiaceae bacterium]
MIAKKKIEVLKCVYTVPNAARPDQKNLVMWVRLGDLPDDLKLDPNARRADVDSRVAKQIRATLANDAESFWKLNSGIQMTARDVEVKDGRVVVVDLDDPEDDAEVADGVINGGHTYECIKLERSRIQAAAVASGVNDAIDAFNAAIVRIEVLTGLGRHELADISRARNTGEAVKKYSLQNLKKLYEPIKKELGATECERIGFCENDVDIVPGKTYQVLDLIRVMSLFNNQLYPSAQ